MLNPRSLVNKIDDFHSWIIDQDLSIIAVAETWFHKSVSDALACPNGYNVFRVDRSSSRGGGVCIVAKDVLNPSQINIDDKFSDIEIVGVDLFLGAKRKCRILCLYCPPSHATDPLFIDQLILCIRELSDHNFATIVTGDFNRPGISWENIFNPTCVSSIDRHFSSELIFLGFTQFVSFPTRGQNFLNLAFCNREDLVQHVEPLPPFCDSDSPPHLPILFCLSALVSDEKTIPTLNYYKADYDAITHLQQNYVVMSRVDLSAVELCNMFYSMIEKSNRHVPSKKHISHRYSPFRSLARLKLKAWRILRLYPCNINQSIYKNISAIYSDSVTYLRSQHLNEICYSHNKRAFYSYASRFTSAKRKIPPLLDSSGNLLTQDSNKAELFRITFKKSYIIDSDIWTVPADRNEDRHCFPDIFAPEAIKLSIKKLRSSSAPGPDGIPPVFFIKTCETISIILSDVFSHCFREGWVPASWRSSLVIPVYKGKGGPSNPSSYRPIALTNIVAKVLERCLLTFILSFISSNNIIPDNQFGFVRGRSPIVQLLTCANLWTSAFDRNMPFDVNYIDILKAFDRIKRNLLWQRLLDMNFPIPIVRLLSAFFDNRTFCVKVGSSISREDSMPSGVVQGTILGPTLFIIYTSPAATILRPIPLYTFADDVKWFFDVDPLSDGYGYQLTWNTITEWFTNNCLEISCSKSTVIHYGSRNPHFIYYIGNDTVNPSCTYKDLGVYVQTSMKFEHHIDYIVSKASRTAFLVLNRFKDCDIKSKVLAYKVYVRPQLEYASQVWSPFQVKDIKTLENVQRKFSRSILHSTAISYKERSSLLGLHSLEWRRLYADLCLCHSLINGLTHTMEESPLVTTCTDRTHRQSRKLKVPFARSSIRQNFFSIRVSRLWNQLPSEITDCVSTNVFRAKLKNFDLGPYTRCYPF